MREKWIFWCGLNIEQDTLKKMLGDDCVSIQGSTPEHKRIELMEKWINDDIPVMVTKVSIFGYGLNFQHCHKVAFIGLSDSFEEMYQAIRRCWRFGQTDPVDVHIIISEKEGNVLQNIKNKEAKAEMMLKRMVDCMSDLTKKEIQNTRKQTIEYKPIKKMEVPKWM